MIASIDNCTAKRARWENSPELRDSVRLDLEEWGRAQRGGMPDLGYPDHQPFTTPPQRDSIDPYNADKVDLMTLTLARWMQEQRKMGDLSQRAVVLKLIVTLRFHFISDRPAEAKAKVMGVSKRTFWRRVDEAMFRFWVRHNYDGA